MWPRTVALVFLLLFCAQAVVAQNPILGPREGSGESGSNSDTGAVAQMLDDQTSGTSLGALIRSWSNALQRRIAELSRRVREEGDMGAALVAFLVSVVFGAVHIAGPGHGKVFALSYFSARESRPVDGVIYSGVVSIIDSLSAFILVFLGYIVLRAVAPAFRTSAPRILEVASYSLIIVFGLWHLAGHLFGGHKDREHGAEDESEHEDRENHVHHHGGSLFARVRTTGSPDRLRPWMLGVTVGLVPCPVSTILLVYGVVNNVLGLMILMVVGVSIGGFATMVVISLAVIAGRKGLLSRLSGGTVGRITTVLEFVASGLIIAAGLVLLIAALS